MKLSLACTGTVEPTVQTPRQRSQRKPIVTAVCLLIIAQASNAFSQDPLTSEQIRRVLSSLVTYQDQFYGKTLEAELLVQESGIHAVGGGKIYAERVVVDTKGERIRWQTAGDLGNLQTSRVVGITRDYAWDGWIGTDLNTTIDGQPRQARIFCRRTAAPRAHTASWLLKPIGVKIFSNDFLTRQRSLLEFLALRTKVYRVTHPTFGEVVSFESGRKTNPLRCYLREHPQTHFVGFTQGGAPRSDNGGGKQTKWVMQLEIDYENQVAHWLPKKWTHTLRKLDQPTEKPAYHVECEVKKLQFPADVSPDRFQVDLPSGVQIVDDCKEQ